MKYAFVLAATAALLASPAAAQFQIEKSTTASQQVTMELLNTVRVKDPNPAPIRSQHNIGVTYGAFDNLTTGLSFELRNTNGANNSGPAMNSFTWHNTLGIIGGEDQPGISVALYSELNVDFDTTNETVLTVGPAIGGDFDTIDFGLNTFATIPFTSGSNDVGFKYAAGAMYDVANGVALGVEAHGTVPAVFNNMPDFDQQQHFAGPAALFEFEPEEGREVGLRIGSFFGLTDAAPTAALSANIELSF